MLVEVFNLFFNIFVILPIVLAARVLVDLLSISLTLAENFCILCREFLNNIFVEFFGNSVATAANQTLDSDQDFSEGSVNEENTEEQQMSPEEITRSPVIQFVEKARPESRSSTASQFRNRFRTNTVVTNSNFERSNSVITSVSKAADPDLLSQINDSVKTQLHDGLKNYENSYQQLNRKIRHVRSKSDSSSLEK